MKCRSSIAIVFFVLLIVVWVIVCSASETISLEDQNMDIVQLSFCAYNEGDWSSFAELHSPGYLQHAPDYKDPIAWSDYELSCRIAHRRLPKLHYRVVDIFSVRDKVACRVVWEIPIDSYEFKIYYPDGIAKGSLLSISLIDGGKIVEEWLEYDPVGINRVLRWASRMERIK